MQCLTRLKTLEIYDCPNLEDNERSKIDHIPFVDIRDTFIQKFLSANHNKTSKVAKSIVC